jgi:hypothetical protein
MEKHNIYLPNNVSAIIDYEAYNLENILLADTARMDTIALQQKERRRILYTGSLFYVHKITQKQKQRTQ